jgi:hypothetical protein
VSDEPPTYPRPWLAWYLADLVPAGWKIIDTFTLPKTIDQVTVTITHTKIEKQPAAPMSDNLVNTMVIRVTDPHEDLERAEDALDEEVLDLVYALRKSDRLVWLDAEKVKADDNPYLAWDINVQVLSTHTPTEEG